MNITCKYLGMIAEATGVEEESISIDGIDNVKQLAESLTTKYNQLGKLTYKIAVNQTIVDEKHTLLEGDEVALLPPFAGG